MVDLRDRVSRVIAERFHVSSERITEIATLDDDLGATSIDRVEVVMSLEDEFKIDISDDQASRLHTVADVLACVMESVAKGRPTSANPPA
ncbi:acyl carrier protein [Reyranella soli]|jgi:acyl carrier protein|uniref:Acyl carrier protein n=1 Tax=Reyranella soli TaxID=1230389 RepID=A0A512N8Y9_9HYPH|nr:acyl carrier protein [Reyranella soli]GEP55456.1 acyl carrier protein [Reyranella soli]